jgi:hypothetical protein
MTNQTLITHSHQRLHGKAQCQAAAFINRFSNVSPKIARIYFYTFTDGRSGDNTGIVNPSGTTPRPAYNVVRDRAGTCRT